METETNKEQSQPIGDPRLDNQLGNEPVQENTNTEQTLNTLINQAGAVASLFVKNQHSVNALSEALQLSPIAIHLGLGFAHLIHNAVTKHK